MTGSRQNLARTKTRLRLDFERIGQALSRPGIDPRAWVAIARIDDDPDAIVWDDKLGWLVDVTFVGGSLDGDGPVNCRVSTSGQGNSGMYARPPRANQLVIVVIPNGDPNDDAIIVGHLADTDNPILESINGDEIVETNARDGQVSATETHIAAFPDEDKDQQWRAVRLTASEAMKIHGQSIELGKKDADQSYVRGEDFAHAINKLADAIGTFAQAIATAKSAPPNAALTVADVLTAQQILAPQIEEFKHASNTYLSQRIKGD